MRSAVELAARAASRGEWMPQWGRHAKALLFGVALVAILCAGLALCACSRPPPPHPEAVAPAADDEPTVCHGPDCELPKPTR